MTEVKKECVYGIPVDSMAWTLIQHALMVAHKQSLGNGKDFLLREVNLQDLKYWEKLAIGDCFMRLAKEGGIIRKKRRQ